MAPAQHLSDTGMLRSPAPNEKTLAPLPVGMPGSAAALCPSTARPAAEWPMIPLSILCCAIASPSSRGFPAPLI
jgi:hypothetical protein